LINKNVAFFAELNGKLLSSSSDESGEKYQIGWSESHKTARTGQIKLRVFDEDGFSALKKAQRNNEDVSKVKEIRVIDFYHQGTYSGPYVQSELLVTILFAAVYYWASKNRSLIQA
jgi:translocon-associated protein subunit delta